MEQIFVHIRYFYIYIYFFTYFISDKIIFQ